MLNITSSKCRIFKPQVKFLPSGNAVCNFSIGNGVKNKDGTWRNFFHNAKAFGKTAEALAEMDKKDIEITRATLDQETWKDKETGKERRKDVVIVWEFTPKDAPPPAEEDPF